MIPAGFEYLRARALDHAIELLNERGGDAKILAGGHSLLPLMKLRLAQPEVLIDLGFVANLSFIEDRGDYLAIGPMVTHNQLAVSNTVRERAELLALAARTVGDPQVRNRGTIGGSLAHGDPAGDLPAAALALNASIVVRGRAEQREVGADDFFLDIWETALAPDEVIAEIRVPARGNVALSTYEKFRQRAGDWATVGVAVQIERVNGTIRTASIALVNVASTPVRAHSAESILAGSEVSPDLLREAAELAAKQLQPTGDLKASADYKRHLVRVLTRRALERLLI